LNIDELTYNLVRELDFNFIDKNNQIIKVKQPKIKDIDELGLLTYLSYTYIFRIKKEHLQLYEEIKDELNDKSLFESILIHEKYARTKNDFSEMNSDVIRLICSIAFFVGIEDWAKIGMSDDEKLIEIYDFKEVNNQIHKTPIFTFNNDNFDEFSELIRTITCNDIIEQKKDKELYSIYDDPELQQAYDELMKNNKEIEEKSENNNIIGFSDIIHDICNNKYSKETRDSIGNRTIWSIFDIYSSSISQESVDFNKQQFCSYKFEFKEQPILDWRSINKIKINKENSKLINDQSLN